MQRLSVVLAVALVACSPAPPDHLVIGVEAENFRWTMRYPGPDRRFGTDDDRSSASLRLPAGMPVELRLGSQDFVYTFALPDQNVHEAAVPGMEFVVSLSAQNEGTISLLGNRMCGYDHEGLNGFVTIVDPEEFSQWHLALPSVVP